VFPIADVLVADMTIEGGADGGNAMETGLRGMMKLFCVKD